MVMFEFYVPELHFRILGLGTLCSNLRPWKLCFELWPRCLFLECLNLSSNSIFELSVRELFARTQALCSNPEFEHLNHDLSFLCFSSLLRENTITKSVGLSLCCLCQRPCNRFSNVVEPWVRTLCPNPGFGNFIFEPRVRNLGFHPGCECSDFVFGNSMFEH